jgi:hypothetical protein
MDYKSKRYYRKWAEKSEKVVREIFKKHNRECVIKTISCSGTVKIKATTIEVDILKEIINAGTAWYHKGRILFLAADPEC